MNTKNNAKAHATHALIKQAFLDLSKHKNAEKISVREICNVAQINRSSFYLHFVDIYDLIEEVNQDMMKGMEEILTQAMTDESVPLKQVFTELFRFIKKSECFLSSYYRNRRSSLRELDLTKSEPFLSRMISAGKSLGFEDEREIRYHLLFFTAGFSAITEEWILGGCVETPEYLSDLIYREYRQQ